MHNRPLYNNDISNKTYISQIYEILGADSKAGLLSKRVLNDPVLYIFPFSFNKKQK